MRAAPLSLAILLCLGAGCGEDAAAPSVRILRTSPDRLDPASDAADDLTIRVEYADGDGDLGGGVAEVHDCRADGVVTRLSIPAIASEEAVAEGVPIAGELTLLVADVGDVPPAAAAPAACAEAGAAPPDLGEAVFCVVLVDAAGHAGPGDCTPAIPLL